MKITRLSISILLAVLLTAVVANAEDIPSLNVVVSDANGHLAYRGRTNVHGTFQTGSLQPGDYVVQLRSDNPAFADGTYALVTSAGHKKTIATAVSGEKFAGRGVAMRINVRPGLSISGQVAPGAGSGLAFFQNEHTGSNLHLADTQNQARYNINVWTPDEVYKFQERTSQPGSSH